jgi:hypothetical protein
VRFLAYLDANSGSMIMAAIAGGLAGIAVLIKLWWRRFTALFSPERWARAKATEAAKASDEVNTAEAAHATDVATAAAQPPAEK